MNKQGDKGISWTDWSSNPIFVTRNDTGVRGHHCTRVSNGVDPSGCDFCYAATWNMGRFGTGLDFIQENDARVTWHLNEKELRLWTGKKAALIFPFDMTDVFHNAIPPEMVIKCFAAMLLSPQMTFQVLTKRPAVMKRLFTSREWWDSVTSQAIEYANEWRIPKPSVDMLPCPLPNVWAGTTVATQKDARARLDILQKVPASLRWISLEPQLEMVTFRDWFKDGGIGWVVQGGESGSGRPFSEEWARSMRDECAEFGVPMFLKQFGEVWAKEHGLFGTDTHAKKMENFPNDLRLHEFPSGAIRKVDLHA